MTTLVEFNAITVDQMQTSEIYYSVPKVLLDDELYQDLRVDSKLLYGVLKDRLRLSIKNSWVDEEGRPYLEYSNSELQRLFNCSKGKVITIKKDLAAHDLIFEYSQFTKGDGQVANRIYVGNVIAYNPEKYKKQRRERYEDRSQKAQVERPSDLNYPRTKIERGASKNYTGAVQELDTNKYLSSENDYSKGSSSSRKAEEVSGETPQPAGANHSSSQSKEGRYIAPKYYNLLQVIADAYNGKFNQTNILKGEEQRYFLTHRQKMMIGQYLADGWVTSQEVLDMIERVPYDCESPLAYLMRMLENLKEERRLEAKIVAHRKAEQYYGSIETRGDKGAV